MTRTQRFFLEIVTITSSHTWLRLGGFRRIQPAYLKRNFFISSQPLRPRWSAEVGITHE
ncbi:hypothetical protein FHT71_003230 [Rhizobium sp. BK060]|nr:hypothetical protein [Rhizobium sp. BK060]